MSTGTPIVLKYGHRYLYADGVGTSDPLVRPAIGGFFDTRFSRTVVVADFVGEVPATQRLRLEIGKRYVDRFGGVTLPLQHTAAGPNKATHPFVAPDPSDPDEVRGRTYTPDGLWGLKGSPSDYDLVAEYKPEGTGFCPPDDEGAVAEMFDPPPASKPPSPEAQLAAAIVRTAEARLTSELHDTVARFCRDVADFDQHALRRIDWAKLNKVPAEVDLGAVLRDLLFAACREHHVQKAVETAARTLQISLAPTDASV